MMKNNVVSHPAIERWTSKRKADLVLEVIKGHKTIVDVARERSGPGNSDRSISGNLAQTRPKK